MTFTGFRPPASPRGERGFCPWCGVKISPDADTCTSHRSVEAQAAKESPPEHALIGFREVRAGSVTRWEPIEGYTPEHADPDDHTIACTLCRVKLWESCVNPRGQVVKKPHARRVTPRQCPCGGGLDRPKQRFCEPCREYRDATSAAASRERKSKKKAA